MSCNPYTNDPIAAKDAEVDLVILTAEDVHCADLHYSSGLLSDPD